jgi:NADP-dependent 3-hydroxy acid dehydrogenase YdfG
MTGAVVVTGAARGIGAAIARRFAEEGYLVVGVDRDGDPLRETLAELPDAQAVVGDVTDEQVMEDACERANPRGLRAFVANAGVAYR